jgi:cob(I)alamin adenosyltransferase
MAFKIYTKTGDGGETSLFGGKRLPKDHIRIESYGTVDELNSVIGIARDSIDDEHHRAILKTIQDRLFDIGSNLAVDADSPYKMPEIDQNDIQLLENEIDAMDKIVPPLKNFILPGGHLTISYCHLARTVCRRAERNVVALSHNETVNPVLIQYLNRLSDYFFTLSRAMHVALNVAEIAWKGKDGI